MKTGNVYNQTDLKIRPSTRTQAHQGVSQDKNETNGFKENFLQEIANESDEGPIGFSGHAVKRMQERNIEMSTEDLMNLREAMNKLRDKGSKNSLVISSKGAYIVDVKNNMVVTAIDKDNLQENVFTKIDSTVVIN